MKRLYKKEDNHYCPHCLSLLGNNISNIDYFKACDYCDEDFFSVEVFTQEDIDKENTDIKPICLEKGILGLHKAVQKMMEY